jgi:hypothetical protein
MRKRNGEVRATRLDIDVVAPLMAEAILSLVKVRAKSPPQLQWNLERGMLLMIRNLERHVQHRVSVEADDRAKKMRLPDLHTLEWRHQPRKMKDKGRKIFHWEHVVRAADIKDEILRLEHPTARQIEARLRGSFLAWILKEENDLLPTGPREDPLQVYKAAGIRFVSLPSSSRK